MKRLIRKANKDMIADLQKLQEDFGDIAIQLYTSSNLSEFSKFAEQWNEIVHSWRKVFEVIDDKYDGINKDVIDACREVIDIVDSINDTEVERTRRVGDMITVSRMIAKRLTKVVQNIEQLIQVLQVVNV